MFKPFHLQCFTFTDIVNSHSQTTPQPLTPYSHSRNFPEEKHQESQQDMRGDIQTSNKKSFCMNTPVKFKAIHGNNSVKMSSEEDIMSAFLNKNSAEHLHKNFSPFYSPSCFQQIPQRQGKINRGSDKAEITALSCGTDREGGGEEENLKNKTINTVKHFLDAQGEILRQKLQKAQEDIDNRSSKAQSEGYDQVSLIGPLKKHLEGQNDANRKEIEDREQEKQADNLISLGIRNRSCDRTSTKRNNNINIYSLDDSSSSSVDSNSLMNSEYHQENISADLMEELNKSFSSLDSVKSKNKLGYQQIYITRSLQVNNALNRFTSVDPLQNSNLPATFLKIYSQPRKQSLMHRQIKRLSRCLGKMQAKQIIQDRAIQHALFQLPSTFQNNKPDLINKMFQCKFCLKSFPKSCSLGGHISRVHKGKSDSKKPQLTRQKGKKQQNESPLCSQQHNTSSSNSPTEKKKQRKDEEFFAQSKYVTKKISKSQAKRKQEEQASSMQLGNLKKALFSNNNLFAEQIPLL